MPLTIDSEELNINYTGFSEKKIKLIKETFVLFQYVSLPEKEKDQKYFSVYLGGEMFGKPGYGYWLYNAKDNYIHVQMVKVRADGYKGNSLFGFYMNTEKKDYIAYHLDQKMGVDDEI